LSRRSFTVCEPGARETARLARRPSPSAARIPGREVAPSCHGRIVHPPPGSVNPQERHSGSDPAVAGKDTS
jgi:hypothetical protein